MHTLTKEDIKNLGMATTVGFSHFPERDGDNFIYVVMEKSYPEGFGEVVIGEFKTHFDIYGQIGGKVASVVFFIDTNAVWQSVVAVLRPGDAVSVRIWANEQRPIVDDQPESPFHLVNVDTVLLRVYRGTKTLEFIIKTELSESSGARHRMIRAGQPARRNNVFPFFQSAGYRRPASGRL